MVNEQIKWRKLFIILSLVIPVCVSSVRAQSPVIKQSVARGKLVYQQVCLTCHQADGGGVPNMNPPLVKSSYVAGDKKRLINMVLKGFSDKVAINGAYYNNNMPPQTTLTDQQIADVLTYVRVNFGNKAGAVVSKDVMVERKGK